MASSQSASAVETCLYCGARLRMYSIFRRPAGLAKAWKRKHERACSKRTPAERRKWSARHIAKGENSALTIDLTHNGFTD